VDAIECDLDRSEACPLWFNFDCCHQVDIRTNPDLPRLGGPQGRDGGGPSVRVAGQGACPQGARQGRGHGHSGSGAPPAPCHDRGLPIPADQCGTPDPPHRSPPHLLAVVGLALGKIPHLKIFLENVNERMRYHPCV
jgi:hypothetical protein